MIKTRKIYNIISLPIIIVIFLIIPCFVISAQGPLKDLQEVGQSGGYAEADVFSLSQFIGTVISTILSLLGVLFISLMIYGGFKWMKASGREEDVKVAQDTIRRAIIGLIIITSAYAIMSYVMASLAG